MARTFMVIVVSVSFMVHAASAIAQPGREDVRYRSGNIRVAGYPQRDGNGKALPSVAIYRDNIHFGFCFADAQYRRLPTTYYHPRGPLGMAFQRFNWFPGEPNTYAADARFPASLVAAGCLGLGGAAMPQLAVMWSEPPVAVIGMEAGTVASYARPGQCFDFYEPTKEIIDLHARNGKDRFFHFIPDAIDRGTNVRVVHGSPRRLLTEQAPRGYYHLMVLEACTGENGEKIFLDLFTQEGIAECMNHLADDGVLCVHTSHRFLDLPPVLARIGAELKLHVRVGHDMDSSYRAGDGNDVSEVGHFTSEWVMLARRAETLDAFCKTPKDYAERVRRNIGFGDEYWSARQPSRHLWTDKGPNLMHGILRGHPFTMRYAAVMQPTVEFICDGLDRIGLSRNSSPSRMVYSLGGLHRAVENMMVASQLRTNPSVEKLWP